MADDSDLERTEPASPRRLEQARDEGQVARSPELTGFLVLLLGGAAAWFGGGYIMSGLSRLVAGGLRFDTRLAHDPAAMLGALNDRAIDAAILVAPLLLMVMVVAVAAPLAIGGWLLSGKPLVPDFSRVNPAAGLGRMFSLPSLVELAKTLGKAAVIATAGALVLWAYHDELATLGAQPLEAALRDLARIVMIALLCVVIAKGLIAAVDVPFQIWRHLSKLRMSREDLRREARETDGDPHIRAAIRSQQRERARQRMMAAVPKADVVVVNPTHYAVALRYDDAAMRAPRVVAKGAGEIAVRIREIAAAHGVPVLQAPPLARALYQHADIGAEIPEKLYMAVAEVLAYIFQLRQHRGAGGPPPRPLAEVAVPPELDPMHGRA